MNQSHHAVLESLERELVSQDSRMDQSRMNELLADDFEEYGSSGRIFRKPDVLTRLDMNIDYALSDFCFSDLADGIALVKYKSVTEDQVALRSSIWVQNDTKWQLLHHQATVVPQANCKATGEGA